MDLDVFRCMLFMQIIYVINILWLACFCTVRSWFGFQRMKFEDVAVANGILRCQGQAISWYPQNSAAGIAWWMRRWWKMCNCNVCKLINQDCWCFVFLCIPRFLVCFYIYIYIKFIFMSLCLFVHMSISIYHLSIWDNSCTVLVYIYILI